MSVMVVDRATWDNALRQIERRTNDRQNAEDLLHSAYLKLERYQESHEVECAIGFLTQTALNIRIDTHRRDDFLRNHILESSICFDRPAPLQDKVVEDRSRLARLKEGLDQLAPRTREIILLYRVEELKQREIATLLGISVSAVEKHIAKAAPFLVEWMEGW
jgi:RNA polymerase sigma factor (sigma-70 family)